MLDFDSPTVFFKTEIKIKKLEFWSIPMIPFIAVIFEKIFFSRFFWGKYFSTKKFEFEYREFFWFRKFFFPKISFRRWISRGKGLRNLDIKDKIPYYSEQIQYQSLKTPEFSTWPNVAERGRRLKFWRNEWLVLYMGELNLFA